MLLHIENGQGGSTGVRLDLRSLKKRFSGVQSEAIAAILEAMARVKETSSVQEFEEEGKNWVTEGEFVEATEHYKQAFSLGDEGYRDFLSTLKGELLKQGVHPIVIFTSEERKAIQSIFSTLDVDGSGHVSLQEFKRRLGTKGAETLQNFDDNKDGRMSIVEFVEGCKRIKKSGQEKLSLFFKTMQRRLSVASNKSLRVNVELNEEEKEILRVLFQQIDINKDQVLDLSELRKRLGTKAAFFLDKFDIDRDQTVRDWEWTRVFQTTKISDPGAFREHLERVKMVCASVANKTFKVPSSAQASRDTGPSDSKASDSKAPDPQKVDGATVGV